VDRVRAPAIPGLSWPRVAHEAYRVDYGPRWREGVITLEPPRLGKPFPVRVPQVDTDGNEVAGVRSLELLAPVATYAPWSLRGGKLSPGELVDFYGTLIPFPRDRADRERTGDPRLSVTERYGDRKRYMQIVARYSEALVQSGWLLVEDVPRVIEQAERHWTWLMGRPAPAER